MLYVRVMVSGQALPSVTSLTNATTGFVEQLSVASVTTLISGDGAGAKGILISVGFDAVGGMLSLTV